MEHKLQIGMIGGGMMAEIHMKCLLTDGRSDIRWLVSKEPEKFAQQTAAFNIHRTTTEYAEMLADRDVDAAIVCTPPALHYKMAADALRAGKHVLVEKPMCLKADEAEALCREAAQHPTLRFSGFTARHARLTTKFPVVRDMIAAGRLGDVYHIHHRMVFTRRRSGIEYNPGAHWFLSRRIAGGGPMINWGVYDLSFHLGVVGDPAFKDATGCFRMLRWKSDPPGIIEYDTETHGAMFMRFNNGMTYYWERAIAAYADFPNQTVIYGTRGGLRLGYCSWDPPEIEFFTTRLDDKPVVEKIAAPPSAVHDNDVATRAMVDYLLDVAPRPMDPAIEVKNLRIINTLYDTIEIVS
jgi:predicted dehydrogenase